MKGKSEMWNTPSGRRILYGAERRLLATASWNLTDSLSAAAIGNENVRFGIVHFDRLTWQQQMLMIDKVSEPLFDPTIPAPTPTAVTEATIAAFYAHILESVQVEIDMEDMDSDNDRIEDSFRYQILGAVREDDDEVGIERELTASSRDMDKWRLVVQSLQDRVLFDEDWQMDGLALDLSPQTGQEFKGRLGIQDGYFIDIPLDGTDEDAESARLRVAKRCEEVLFGDPF